MIQKWTKTEHLKIFNGLIRDFKGYYSSYTPVKILSTKMQKFEKKMIISCQVRTRTILRVKSYLLILASFTGEINFFNDQQIEYIICSSLLQQDDEVKLIVTSRSHCQIPFFSMHKNCFT